MTQEWKLFHVGLRRAEWLGLPDGLVIDWTDDFGLTLFAYYKDLTAKEAEGFGVGKRFKIAFKDVDGVGFFLFKFGDQPWCDCSFTPNFNLTVPEFREPKIGEGYSLNIMLIDTSVGELKVLRSVALGKEFTDSFRAWCLKSLEKNIGRLHYNNVVDKVQKMYQTATEMAAEADISWTHTRTQDERLREEHEHE